MPKLRNVNTGVIVETSGATAASLGAEWVSADAKPETVKRKPGRPKKSD